jgi:hypothetical protein
VGRFYQNGKLNESTTQFIVHACIGTTTNYQEMTENWNLTILKTKNHGNSDAACSSDDAHSPHSPTKRVASDF